MTDKKEKPLEGGVFHRCLDRYGSCRLSARCTGDLAGNGARGQTEKSDVEVSYQPRFAPARAVGNSSEFRNDSPTRALAYAQFAR